jgi:hypothetical protein
MIEGGREITGGFGFESSLILMRIRRSESYVSMLFNSSYVVRHVCVCVYVYV